MVDFAEYCSDLVRVGPNHRRKDKKTVTKGSRQMCRPLVFLAAEP